MIHSAQPDGWAANVAALGALAVPPDQFWPRYCAVVAQATGASAAEVFSRQATVAEAPWLALAPDGHTFDTRVSPALMRAARTDGVAAAALHGGSSLALAMLPTTDTGREVALLLTFATQSQTEQRLQRLAALAMAPILYERSRETRLAGRDALRLSQGLVLLGNLLDSADFNTAATALVNRMAELFACEQVFLTWRKLGGQRLAAVSHGDIPNQRSAQAAQIEELAQDALAQRGEILFPPRDQSAEKTVSQAAARFAEAARPGNLAALPMIDTDAAGRPREWGAVVLTRRLSPFTEAEQWALRLFVEMAQRLLIDRSETRRMLPLRLTREVSRSLPKLLQVKTGAGRALLAGAGVAVLTGLLVPVPYSISATAVLKTDSTVFVGAPYNGYVAQSSIDLGDRVAAGDVLFTMATDEITLERGTRLAELAQANRDAEINRSLGKLPEMQLARARADETKAQLQLLDARLASASVAAPMAGVVVQGEPAKRLGQAVSRGDMLVTVAKTDGLDVEAAVPERDLNLIAADAGARLTLLASPDLVFALKINRVVPSARTQDGGNVFPVLMSTSAPAPDWWLPGMTGVVKIDAGHRPIIWTAMRQLVDYLRLKLWI